MLLLLQLHLGGGADLDHRHAAGQLRQPLLELLAVVVGVGVVDLGLDLVDPTGHVGMVAGALDDGGLVLGDHDLAGLAEHVERDALELEPDLLGDDLAAREDRHVLEHRLAPLTEPGRLDRDRGERAPDLVDHEGGEGLTLDVLGDHEQGPAGLHHLLEHRHEVAHRGDLRADQQDVRVVEHRLHPLGVGDEVGRDVALVEAHALDEVHLEPEGLALLDGDHTVLADLVDRLGDDVADLLVGRGDGGDVGDLLLVLRDVLRVGRDRLDRDLDGLLDAALHRHRVGAGRDVAQTLAHHRPGEDGGGGGAVAGDVVGLLGDLLDQLGADLLVGVLELDLLGDGDAVVGDGGGAPLLLEDHVAALRAEGDPDRVGELVHARLEAAPGLLIELNGLGHHSSGNEWVTAVRAVGTLTPRVLIQPGATRIRNHAGSGRHPDG